MGNKPTVTVDAKALGKILSALSGAPHLIREIQMTRSLPEEVVGENAINMIIRQFNEQAIVHNAGVNNEHDG